MQGRALKQHLRRKSRRRWSLQGFHLQFVKLSSTQICLDFPVHHQSWYLMILGGFDHFQLLSRKMEVPLRPFQWLKCSIALARSFTLKGISWQKLIPKTIEEGGFLSARGTHPFFQQRGPHPAKRLERPAGMLVTYKVQGGKSTWATFKTFMRADWFEQCHFSIMLIGL